MFNKIRKMIKNEKGFTLVELLAVIVILGIIVAIAIPAIGNVINKAEDDANDAEIGMIIDAARLYEMQYEPEEGDDGTGGDGKLPVTVQELLNAGFLEERQGELSEQKEIGENLKDLEVGRDENGKLELREPTEVDPDGE